METVFITIHDLSLDARIKYASDSVEDILGYRPHEVKGKSCWEYFHPDEIPFAREVYGRGINLDKAAVLNYCQIKHKDGSWVGCECVFTIVYDVLVASTSIYKRGPRSRQRAIEGAGIRRIFSSSPRDPRYHMLSFISNKFYQEPKLHANEVRAALFLNRFTRSSTIMFATNGVASILGLRPEQLVGKSFYYCVKQNCLQDAVRCLESAKANDSIAYLRFWYRDPLQADYVAGVDDPPISNGHVSDEEDDDGGVRIRREDTADSDAIITSPPVATPISVTGSVPAPTEMAQPGPLPTSEPPLTTSNGEDNNNSRTSSGNSTDLDGDAADAIFDPPARRGRSQSSMTPAEDHQDTSIEIEAVVSCSSDGLVVILRRARPLIPHTLGGEVPHYANGLFASPWALEPVMPPNTPSNIPPEAAAPPGTELEPASFMTAIREVAVFAWSLTGINGTLTQYAHGKPSGESLPAGGLPVWDPKADVGLEADSYNGFAGSTHRPIEGMADPYGIKTKESEESSSEDEILWKRVPNMAPWRRPTRRGHDDAFGADGESKEDEERGNQSRRRKMS